MQFSNLSNMPFEQIRTQNQDIKETCIPVTKKRI